MKDEKNMENMNQTPNPEPEKTETAKAGKNRRGAADSMRFQSDLLKSSQKKRSAKPGLSARKWQYGTISVGLVIAFIAVIVMANAGIS